MSGSGAIRAALLGVRELGRDLDRLERASYQASRKAVDATSRKVQLGVRREVDAIFSGGKFSLKRGRANRIANTVRRRMYDNGRDGSASVIYSTFGRSRPGGFEDYFGPYITGEDITPRRGKYIAIPLQRGVRNRHPKLVDGLRTVQTGGRLYLVKTTRTRTLFMFLLLPRVKIRKRIDPAAVARRELDTLGREARRHIGVYS